MLIIGGSGDLGSACVKKFIGGRRLRRWRVFNIDAVANPEATKNFLIDPTEPLKEETVKKLHEKIADMDEEYEMMVNTAGYFYHPNTK